MAAIHKCVADGLADKDEDVCQAEKSFELVQSAWKDCEKLVDAFTTCYTELNTLATNAENAANDAIQAAGDARKLGSSQLEKKEAAERAKTLLKLAQEIERKAHRASDKAHNTVTKVQNKSSRGTDLAKIVNLFKKKIVEKDVEAAETLLDEPFDVPSDDDDDDVSVPKQRKV